MTPPYLALAWQNIASHPPQEGDRLVVMSDGRMRYERLKHATMLRIELSIAGDPLLAEVLRAGARLRAERSGHVQRAGYSGEATVVVHHTDVTGELARHLVLEHDFDKLPSEDVLADVKRIVTQLSRHALDHGTGESSLYEDTPDAWPNVLPPALA